MSQDTRPEEAPREELCPEPLRSEEGLCVGALGAQFWRVLVCPALPCPKP